MPTSSTLIAQVEEALATPKVLDRDLVQNLLDLTKALESALFDICQQNLELQKMDENVALAADAIKAASEQLQAAFHNPADVESTTISDFVEQQLQKAKSKLHSQ